MKQVILCTTHCPKCKILQKKIEEKKVQYQTITDTNQIKKYGLSVPMLIIKDGSQQQVLQFLDAVKYINNL